MTLSFLIRSDAHHNISMMRKFYRVTDKVDKNLSDSYRITSQSKRKISARYYR